MNKKEILIVSVPYFRESDETVNEVGIDFLFGDEENTIVSINNEEEYNDFIENMDDIKLNKKDNKMYYHSHAMENYLKKHFSNSYKGINPLYFEPNNFDKLDSMLARNDNIIILLSEYVSIIYLPAKVKPKHIRSMDLLKSFFGKNDKMIVQRIISSKERESVEGISFEDLMNTYFQSEMEKRGNRI